MSKNTSLALILIVLWTSTITFLLYSIDAHLHYRSLSWAIPIGIVVLAIHMVNMTIFFKICGKSVYSWNNYKVTGGSS
jgi:hypothetical protein